MTKLNAIGAGLVGLHEAVLVGQTLEVPRRGLRCPRPLGVGEVGAIDPEPQTGKKNKKRTYRAILSYALHRNNRHASRFEFMLLVFVNV